MTGVELRLEGVGCVRGGRRLFADLSLVAEPGAAVRVTGANGAGKTSLLRIAAGLLRPSEGRVAATGAIALADERSALDEERPLGVALAFWTGLTGGDAPMALAAMGLEPLAEVPVRYLSAGQRRRAGLARILASRAAIWLLDEPANGLDAAARVRLEQAIADHRATGGVALVATHQPLDLAGAAEVTL